MKNIKMIASPIGCLYLAEENGSITDLTAQEESWFKESTWQESWLLDEAARQLEEYFAQKRQNFELPLAPKGTPFQQKVWQTLQKIPYGQTRSYQEIAVMINSPKSCRAVGGANHHNPVMIIIPCHRVIGKNGSLTGFGGGLSMKEALLQIEGIQCLANKVI